MAAPGTDSRLRSGGFPIPQTVREIEEVVASARAKIDTIVSLLETLEGRQSVDGGILIAPRKVLDQASEELFNIEWPTGVNSLDGGRA